MQIHRLTEIVFILLKDDRSTAKILAERFEVSTRTIYRDIEVLCGAGIPVYTDKGNGGGISILSDFRLSNSILSDMEKQEIITMLTAYNATINSDTTNGLLDKLSGVFKTKSDFIEVDFSDWSNSYDIQEKFDGFKNYIMDKRVVTIDYQNMNGIKGQREIEPLKLIFKSRAWYLYAYCTSRNENRLFKLARVSNVVPTSKHFDKICSEKNIAKKLEWKGDVLTVVLKFDSTMASMMQEEQGVEGAEKQLDGGIVVTRSMPLSDWVYGYILSYGDRVEVIEPLWLKEKIRAIHKAASEL